MKLSTVNPDFRGLVAQLTAELGARGSWKDILVSSTGNTLIEFMSAIGTILYSEIFRSVEEANINTAVNRSSINAIANLLGVSPRRSVGGEVSVTFTLNSALAESVNFNKYDAFTVDGVPFYLTQSLTISANTLSIENVKLRQGTLLIHEFTSSGSKWQQFFVGSNFTSDNEYIDVQVGSDPSFWNKTTNPLWLYSTDDKIYSHTTMPDGTVRILFGEGNYGVIPNSGDTIRIYELITLGSASNKSTSGLSVSPVIVPEVNGTPIELSGLTTSAIIGGDNSEDIDVLRFTVPRIFASGKRAITRSDWKALGLQFPNVKDINVWGEFEEGSQLSMMNTVKVTLLMGTGTATATEKSNFNTYIEDFKHLSTRLLHQDASPIRLGLAVDVYVRLGFILDQIKSEVLSVIHDKFSLSLGVLGKSVQVSDIIDLIMSIKGVDYLILKPTPIVAGFVGCSSVSGLSGTAFTSGGSLPDGTYYFKVTAFKDSQETGSSLEASATVSGGGGSGRVDLSWSAVTSATEYRVYIGTTSGSQSTYFISASTFFSYTGSGGASQSPPAIGTLPSVTNYYTITYFDSNNLEGDKSSELVVSSPTNGSIALSWLALSGATKYRIYRGTSSGVYTSYFDVTTVGYTDIGNAGTLGSPNQIFAPPVSIQRYEYITLQPTPIINVFTTQRK
jgi:hypothetical protein